MEQTPDRIIKDSIHESEDINKMTDFQFRLWVNLIAYVDDYGRGDARPAVIKGKCFPLRERLTHADINAALNALAGIGCVSLYEVDGKPYLYFPKWESHQCIKKKVAKCPAPPNCKKPRTEEEHKGDDLFSDFCGDDLELLQALQDFEEMRKKIKKPLSDRARELLLKKLKEFPESEWVEIINQSIFHNWQGIFPLKKERRNSGTNNIFLQIAEEEYGQG